MADSCQPQLQPPSPLPEAACPQPQTLAGCCCLLCHPSLHATACCELLQQPLAKLLHHNARVLLASLSVPPPSRTAAGPGAGGPGQGSSRSSPWEDQQLGAKERAQVSDQAAEAVDGRSIEAALWQPNSCTGGVQRGGLHMHQHWALAICFPSTHGQGALAGLKGRQQALHACYLRRTRNCLQLQKGSQTTIRGLHEHAYLGRRACMLRLLEQGLGVCAFLACLGSR